MTIPPFPKPPMPQSEMGQTRSPKKNLSVGIVVELDNIRNAQNSRARFMFDQLREQTRRLSNRVTGPIDLNVVFDPAHISETETREFLESANLIQPKWLRTEMITAAGAGYYEQKNVGAAACTTDIVVLLDSDIKPAPTWLQELLRPFDDPSVNFVFGETRFETDTLYEKSFALTIESFPTKQADGSALIDQTYFLANSLAYRSAARSHPFFPASDAYRGHCALASQQVRDAGHKILMTTQAKATHPAPNGIGHFFARAFVEGHDELILTRTVVSDDFAGRLKASPIGSTLRFLKSCFGAWKRTIELHRRVELAWWQVPIPIVVAGTYYSTRYIGELLTFINPRLVRSVGMH